jgi:trans-2,3-dihydro-3-hydroxyanthranilate isomerase
MTRRGSTVRFVLVDVFASVPLTGNPVSIVPDADDLTDARMQAIAREFNQSETVFVLRPDRPEATWRLRSFTPIGAEVFGAGHNALGTWIWLAADGRLPGGRSQFAQQIGPDVLPVRVDAGAGQPVLISMDQSAPQFGATVNDRAELAAALSLAEQDLAADATPQVVSTGAGHLMVAVGTRAGVDRAAPHAAPLAAILDEAGGEGCYVYSLQPGEDGAAAYARFFNPAMGIPEDPATGTAAGPLAARLVASGKVPGGTVVIEQGHALGRPSRIQVSIAGTRVTITGSGLVVADGVLHL